MGGVTTTRPIIGVTSYRERASMGVWDTDATYLPSSYASALWKAGALVVVLPPQDAQTDDASRVVSRLDGLLVSGGYDVAPERYGHARRPLTDDPRPFRDEWEIALLEAAAGIDLPILGICRGAQVLNVARGGTLHQHLPEVVGHTKHQGANGIFSQVRVTIPEGSLLASLQDDGVLRPVYHHQAIDALGEGLTVTARCADGIVQAVEDSSLTFCVATQWHPEQDDASGALFEGFVDAARRFAAKD